MSEALLGGVLIGLAAAALLFFNGRIAGISGIVNGLAGQGAGERGWRIAFLLGLAGAGVLVMKLTGQVSVSPATTPVLVLAGLLVGFGTRLGNGCTSGHGVCGLARLSLRSLVAVLVFMAAAVFTVFVTRHLAGGAG
ncbi:YeeE/YedE thiosulfate transporter family protein [Pseudoxanthomonas sp. PXM04]|uniref:YeeE/YedE family protein n=1 Tax=Pseudoxanthomonas sp. PXM04 TaxID=2769297 RepID=UPI001785BCFD|nr:YeeE/YedE thiosulfate transporter family protein [Pseudoxanthomonas sp. PXM04]MBD9379545.1 YeeE/YedE family protein [Pseudoxanthomonas sp. PXM04]